jgi:hypothetical protein
LIMTQTFINQLYRQKVAYRHDIFALILSMMDVTVLLDQ